MTEKFKNEEQARQEIGKLEKRKEEIRSEGDELARQIEERKGEIAGLIVLRRDASKLTTQNAADLQRLEAMREAVKIVGNEIEAAREYVGRQHRRDYEQLKAQFAREAVAFMDDDLSAVFEKFHALKSKFDAMQDAAGRAYVNRQESAYPFFEQQVFGMLSHFLGDRGGLLSEVKRANEKLADYFEQARGARVSA